MRALCPCVQAHVRVLKAKGGAIKQALAQVVEAKRAGGEGGSMAEHGVAR